MRVTPLVNVEFNDLRAEYPMQIRPQMGYTDNIGETASTGYPRYNTDDDGVTASNDQFVFDAGGMAYDPNLKCVYPRELFVIHQQSPADDGYDYDGYNNQCTVPTVYWNNLYSTDGCSLRNPVRAPGFTSMLAKFVDGGISTDDDGSMNSDDAPWYIPGDLIIQGYGCVACQGFTYIGKMLAPMILGDATAAHAVRWRVTGSGSGKIRWYCCVWENGTKPRFGYNDYQDTDGTPLEGNWVYVDVPKLGSKLSDLFTPSDTYPETQVFQVKLLAGQMCMYFGSEDTPYIWPHWVTDGQGNPDWYVDLWQAFCQNAYTFEWSIHETKFLVTGDQDSVIINMGFAPTDDQLATVEWRVHYAPNFGNWWSDDPSAIGWHPPGTQAVVTTKDQPLPTLIRYHLRIVNTQTGSYKDVPYADFTAAVRSVTMDMPGTSYSYSKAPTVLGSGSPAPNLPQQIDVWWDFDLDTLQIKSRAALTFNNFSGQFSSGQNTGYFDRGRSGVGLSPAWPGLFACRVDLGIAGINANVLWRVFTGTGGVRFENNWPGAANRDTITVHAQDLWHLLDVPAIDLPQMEGWNLYYFLAYMLSLGTVTRDQMVFSSLVPSNPYAPSNGLSDDEQYFLPVGVAGNPLLRNGLGDTISSVILKVTNALGFVTFWDTGWAYGGLNNFGVPLFHAQKFSVSSINPVKYFSHVAEGNPGNVQLNEIWNGSFSGGMSEMRNGVYVIGPRANGAAFDPIVSSVYDGDSVFDETAYNYIGYPSKTVWVDSMFASNQGFADAAAAQMLAYLRIPDRSVGLTSWFSADQAIYPLNQFGVTNPRSNAATWTFLTIGTHVQVIKGRAPMQEYSGRIVQGLAP